MATPLKRQFEVEPGTCLGKGRCSGCGKPVKIMASKSGAAYYNCYNSSDDAEPCQHHERWGGVRSRDMRRAYLVKSGAIQPTKIQKPAPSDAANQDARPTAANLNRPPVKAVDQDKPKAADQDKPKPKGTLDDYGL